MTDVQRSGPLADLTVIDCTMALAGPFGTSLLADLGADVIKIEPPRGDGFRPIPPFPPDYNHAARGATSGADYGAPFAGVNGNKRSVCLDFKNADDKEILLQLCEKADAIVENMRSGVMDNLGLGYETVAARNPQIVYGAVRGFGDPRTGESPYADWPCFDVAAQSMGGLVQATGDLVPIAVADIFPGTLMALGVVSAIHHAKASGRGQFIDVAMYDSVLTLLKTNVAAHSFSQEEPAPGRRANLVPFGLFPTNDGQIAIAAPQRNHWQALCEIMERLDLVDDGRTKTNGARVRNQEFTEQEIGAWTRKRGKNEIAQLLGGRVPVGPVNSMAEILTDPHVAARKMINRFPLPGDNPEVAIAGNALKFSRTPTSFHQNPPRLGEHTDEVLAQFGIERRVSDSARKKQN
jgi:crotonobetainyl-CoA:carnitine CoA-transferase CaiB-like acyl-CoA transferase